jgi:hypothetical protein
MNIITSDPSPNPILRAQYPIRIRKNPIRSELQYKLHMMLVGFGFMGSYHGKCSTVELSQKGYVDVRGLTKCVKYLTDDRK